jgi:hypothetical protein
MNIPSFNPEHVENYHIRQFQKWLKRDNDHQQIIVELRVGGREPDSGKINMFCLFSKADGVASALPG